MDRYPTFLATFLGNKRLCAAALLIAAASAHSPAMADQVRYSLVGVGSGIVDFPDLHHVPFSDVTVTLSVVGDTSNIFDDVAREIRFIPIYQPAVTFNGVGGSASPPILSVPPGVQRLFAVGLGSLTGNFAFGNVEGGVFDLGIIFSGAGLIGYDGLSSLASTPVAPGDIVTLDFADGSHTIFTDFSSLNFSATVLGGSAADPLVALGDVSGGFTFNFDPTGGVPVYVDPLVATGYDFVLGAGSPLITEAIFPVIGSSTYDIYALNDLSTPLFTDVAGGVTIDFTSLAAYANGIFGFALRGIDVGAGLDPSDSTAFVTGLTFAEDGAVSLQQIPISISVAEPASWALMIAGFSLVGGMRRRIRPRFASA